VSPPRYSPDGSRLAFFDTKPGISPSGAGALFVMGTDGSDVTRLTPWGFAFDDFEWSPDGAWIVFQKPYGRLFLIRPDGSGLHAVPFRLPDGAGAENPSWSPDGAWIVFSLERGNAASISAIRPDGTGLTRVTTSEGTQESNPDWVP
jgi:TolB protein